MLGKCRALSRFLIDDGLKRYNRDWVLCKYLEPSLAVETVASVDKPRSERSALSLVGDYVELIKPRIALMVLLTVIVAGFLAAGGAVSVWGLLNVSIGVLLISASGSAWNQYLERYTDFLMPRTALRPLPDHRLTANQVTTFGAITFGAGIAYLWAVVGLAAMFLGLATWFLYVLVYTPMKLRTWWNTAVGAVAGAMPVLIGAVGAGGRVSPLAWGLFVILFLWQFPHFMAIAWLYRRDYTEGGLKMITVVDPSGRLAGWHAIVCAWAVLIASVATGLLATSLGAQIVVAGMGGLLGVWYLAASIQFARHMDDGTARRLLRVSLIHLPLVLLALVVARAME